MHDITNSLQDTGDNPTAFSDVSWNIVETRTGIIEDRTVIVKVRQDTVETRTEFVNVCWGRVDDWYDFLKGMYGSAVVESPGNNL